jgi:hypothetical protein
MKEALKTAKTRYVAHLILWTMIGVTITTAKLKIQLLIVLTALAFPRAGAEVSIDR